VRLVAFFEYAAPVIGIAAMIAGHFLSQPKFFHLGVFLVGAGLAFAGLLSLFTRRMAFRLYGDAFESYAGLPAVIVGLMALVIGAAGIGSAYLLDMGQWHSMVNALERRPAPLLGTAGLLLLGLGVLLLLNPQGHHSWTWRLLVYAPRATVGILVFVAGLAGIALGAWEWMQPQAYDAFVASLPQRIKLLF
jgi:hypothetical protein